MFNNKRKSTVAISYGIADASHVALDSKAVLGFCHFERLTIFKAPGFAGGYLLMGPNF